MTNHGRVVQRIARRFPLHQLPARQLNTATHLLSQMQRTARLDSLCVAARALRLDQPQGRNFAFADLKFNQREDGYLPMVFPDFGGLFAHIDAF